MTPEELAKHLNETGLFERDEVAHGELSMWASRDGWVAGAEHLKECGRCRFDFFTFISAVDLEDEGFEVVCHLYSVRRQHHINYKTLLPRTEPRLRTLKGLWLGADWGERETHELFGIDFDGHGDLRKLLLPDEFEGFPLRKDFLLMSREIKEWPGLKEPEEVK
ncbi:MAG TPA: NADH-quinone oxidoreductase subunit C [Actinomycetota bacterium]